MTNKEFKDYVFEQRRQGRSDSQIARSLGMSLAHLMGKLNGVDVDKVDPPKTAQKEKAAKNDERKKAVDLKKSAEKHDIEKLEKEYQSEEAPKDQTKPDDTSWMD